MNEMNIRDKVLRILARAERKAKIRVERKAVASQKLERDEQLNETWAGIADYFACDGSCFICQLGKNRFRERHYQRGEQ